MDLIAKLFRVTLVALCLMVGTSGAMAAEPVAAVVTPQLDPAVWGMYARLPGTVWNGEGGNIEWIWRPDNSIVETRTGMRKSVIRPGTHPGELVWEYGSLYTYDSRTGADGSVLWLRRGRPAKKAALVRLVDGRFVEEIVKLDEAQQVVKVSSSWPYRQISGPTLDSPNGASTQHATVADATGRAPPVPAIAVDAVPTTPAVAAPAPAAAMGFRGLEPFVGKRLLSAKLTSSIELQHGTDGTLVIQFYNFDGDPNGRYVLSESPNQPGVLRMLQPPYHHDDLDLTAEWTSDGWLALSSRGNGRGDWVTNWLLRAEDDHIAYRLRSHRVGPIPDEYDSSGVYVTPTAALIARGQALKAAEEARLAELEAAAAASCQGPATSGSDGLIGLDEDGEPCALDGEWGAEEDRAHVQVIRGGGQESESPMKAIYDALQEANAAADAHLAQTQADYDATMEQAQRQARRERAHAADNDDADDRRRQLTNAQQATQRQHEIAEQNEARRREDAVERQQGDAMSQPLPAGAPRAAACTQVHPKVDAGANTARGEEAGIALVREKAAEFCLVRTGNPGYSGSASCTADGPNVFACAIIGECAGLASSTCSNSQ